MQNSNPLVTIFNGRVVSDDNRTYIQMDVRFRHILPLFRSTNHFNALALFTALALRANAAGWVCVTHAQLIQDLGSYSENALGKMFNHLYEMRLPDGTPVLSMFRTMKDGMYARTFYHLFPALGGVDGVLQMLDPQETLVMWRGEKTYYQTLLDTPPSALAAENATTALPATLPDAPPSVPAAENATDAPPSVPAPQNASDAPAPTSPNPADAAPEPNLDLPTMRAYTALPHKPLQVTTCGVINNNLFDYKILLRRAKRTPQVAKYKAEDLGRVLDTLHDTLYGTADTLVRKTRYGRLACVLHGNKSRHTLGLLAFEEQRLGGVVDLQALQARIVQFGQDWEREKPGLNKPLDKFVEHYATWVQHAQDSTAACGLCGGSGTAYAVPVAGGKWRLGGAENAHKPASRPVKCPCCHAPYLSVVDARDKLVTLRE